MKNLFASLRGRRAKIELLEKQLEFEKQLRASQAKAKPRLILHGWNDAQMRQAFLASPDSDVFKGTLEQCDQNLMDAVNALVNESEALTDGQLRQRVGELRGISELREKFEARELQARKDQQAAEREEGKDEDGG